MKNKPTGLCVKCGIEHIYNYKRKLCKACYGHYYREHMQQLRVEKFEKLLGTLEEDEQIIHHASERDFVKNFFTHNNWIYQPCSFRISQHVKYFPDFYDGERGIFIEVSSCDSVYLANKAKYDILRKDFKLVPFEIRRPDGSLYVEK